MSAKVSAKKSEKKHKILKNPKRAERELAPAHLFVEIDDELSFVLEKIIAQKAKRIFLSADENAQLMFSPISMKLLQERMDEMGKTMIVVTENSVVAKRLLDVGIMVLPSPDNVEKEVWLELEEDSQDRFKKLLIKKDAPDKAQIEYALEKVRQMEAGQSTSEAARQAIAAEAMVLKRAEELASQVKDAPEKENSEIKDNKDSKNKAAPNGTEPKEVNLGGFTMVVGGDILDKEQINTGKEMPYIPRRGLEENIESAKSTLKPSSNYASDANTYGQPKRINSGLLEKTSQLTNPFKEFFSKIDFAKIKEKVFRPQVLVPTVIGLIVIMVLVYFFIPRVTVNMNVESISEESTFEAKMSLNTETIDLEKYEIPAFREVEKRSGSDTAQSTGTGQRGDKASGTVTVYNENDSPVTLTAGSKIAKGNLQFMLKQTVVVPQRPDPLGKGSAQADVVAMDIGSEYNLPKDTIFVVLNQSKMQAVNNGNAFLGGSKETYRSVVQADIDGLTEKLKKMLFEEGEATIKDLRKNDPKWKIINETIKNVVEGEAQSDSKAGDEKEMINMSLETKTTALFYDKEGLFKLVEKELKKKADTKINVEAEEPVDFKIDENVDIKIKVLSSDDESAKLEITAKGLLSPQIDIEALKTKVKGQNWVRGAEIIKNTNFVRDDVKVFFSPSWFPSFLYRFPDSENRIRINTSNVSSEGT